MPWQASTVSNRIFHQLQMRTGRRVEAAAHYYNSVHHHDHTFPLHSKAQESLN